MQAPPSARPTGITILAVLAAISGVLGLLGSLAVIGLGGALASVGYGGLYQLIGFGILAISVGELVFAYGACDAPPLGLDAWASAIEIVNIRLQLVWITQGAGFANILVSVVICARDPVLPLHACRPHGHPASARDAGYASTTSKKSVRA